MAVLAWSRRSAHERSLRDASAHLKQARDAIGSDPARWEKFYVKISEVRRKFPELSILIKFNQESYAEIFTNTIEKLYPDRRGEISKRLIALSSQTSEVAWVDATALRMVATWMRLVDIRSDRMASSTNAAAANELIRLYEAELNELVVKAFGR